MQPKITLITLGVDDLERSLKFYRDGLGFPTEGILGGDDEHGGVVFIDLQPGVKLALWPRWSIAKDAKVPQQSASATEFAIGHNVGSREEVDAAMAVVERTGATITVPAQDTFWGGYSGYFQDPDGHLWEIAWNPHWN